MYGSALRATVLCALCALVVVIGDALTSEQPVDIPPPVYTLPVSTNDSALRELGRMLFYDTVLSVDGSTSCATCHQQFSAFSHIDHALSHGVEGRIGRRNVPALQNLAWQTSYMWDGAIEHLDMQALSPLTGHDELGEMLPNVLDKITRSAFYAPRFVSAFGSDTVSIPRIITALGRFGASLVSMNSRYDRFRRSLDSLTTNELRGYKLFQLHCNTCHTEPLFTNNTFVSSGLPADSMLNDSGRYRVTHDVLDMYRFRVPSLRNIAVTHPYMHDGRFKRLRDVMAFYADPSRHASHADPRIGGIGVLNDAARKDIIAFLLTLTDDEFLRSPQHADPFTAIQR